MTNNNLTKITAEPAKQEIIIEREFEAPRELVFKAFTGSRTVCTTAWPKRAYNDS